jgi:outer membrane protein assembly factor BamB
VQGSALQPVVAGDLALVAYTTHASHNGVSHGVLEALDLRSGQLRWHHEAGTQAGELVIAGSAIYFISWDNPLLLVAISPGHVEALDRQSGRLLWSHPPVHGFLVEFGVSGDTAFEVDEPDPASPCGIYGGGGPCYQLFAFNASNGSTRWVRATDANNATIGFATESDSSGGTIPLIRNQLVYVEAAIRTGCCTLTDTLLALRVGDGKVAWQRPGDGAPALGQSGDILCRTEHASQGGFITVGLDAKTGQSRWTTKPVNPGTPCIASANTFYRSADEGIPVPGCGCYQDRSSVVALASSDGHQLWRSHGVIWSGRSRMTWVAHGFVGQVLTVPANDGTVNLVVVYHADSGALAWQHEFRQDTLDPSTDQVRVEGGQVYITTPTIQPSSSLQIGQSEIVTAFSLSTGAQLWTYETGHMS